MCVVPLHTEETEEAQEEQIGLFEAMLQTRSRTSVCAVPIGSSLRNARPMATFLL